MNEKPPQDDNLPADDHSVTSSSLSCSSTSSFLSKNSVFRLATTQPNQKKWTTKKNKSSLRLPLLHVVENPEVKSTPAYESKGSFFDTGIYDPQVNSMYQVLTRENSVMLPPLQTSSRPLFNVYDHNMIKERRVVMEDFKKLGAISKYERDELFVPDVFRHKLSCQTCRKEYVSKMFTKEYLKRNNKHPSCDKMLKDRNNTGHFCDVLGKKYCSHCRERENREVIYPSTDRPEYFREISHDSHIGNNKRRKIGVDLRFAFQ